MPAITRERVVALVTESFQPPANKKHLLSMLNGNNKCVWELRELTALFDSFSRLNRDNRSQVCSIIRRFARSSSGKKVLNETGRAPSYRIAAFGLQYSNDIKRDAKALGLVVTVAQVKAMIEEEESENGGLT